MKEKIEKEDLLIRCDCGHPAYLEMGYDWEHKDWVFISITTKGEGLIEKIKGIIRILKGSQYGITDELILNKRDINKIRKFLSQLEEKK